MDSFLSLTVSVQSFCKYFLVFLGFPSFNIFLGLCSPFGGLLLFNLLKFLCLLPFLLEILFDHHFFLLMPDNQEQVEGIRKQ